MLGRWDDDDDDDLVGCTAVGSVHRTPWARDLSVANTATSSPAFGNDPVDVVDLPFENGVFP